MAIITGGITDDGALIDLCVLVSRLRQQKLVKLGLGVPSPVHLRAIIDSGSSVTGFHPSVFAALELGPIQTTPMLTPSTRPDEPHLAKVYDIRVVLVSGMDQYTYSPVGAVESLDFDPRHPDHLLGIIGRDVLDHCIFDYFGPHREFRLSF